jgi:hypothetical protein
MDNILMESFLREGLDKKAELLMNDIVNSSAKLYKEKLGKYKEIKVFLDVKQSDMLKMFMLQKVFNFHNKLDNLQPYNIMFNNLEITIHPINKIDEYFSIEIK